LPDFRCILVFVFGEGGSFATRFAGQKAPYRVRWAHQEMKDGKSRA
jgi:hypothetical protein